MSNKYLEKIASAASDLRVILQDHHHAVEQIDAPILEMRNRMDLYHSNPYQYSTDPSHEGISEQLEAMNEAAKDTEERHLRRELGLDAKHDENVIHTAKAMMSSHGMDPSLITDSKIANNVYNELVSTPSGGWNGYQVSKNLGVIGGIVAGGLGGAFASGRHFGRGTEMLGAIGGAIAGGVGSHYALKSGMGHLIEGRNTEIHDKYEGNIENAYATLNRRLQKQD